MWKYDDLNELHAKIHETKTGKFDSKTSTGWSFKQCNLIRIYMVCLDQSTVIYIACAFFFFHVLSEHFQRSLSENTSKFLQDWTDQIPQSLARDLGN